MRARVVDASIEEVLEEIQECPRSTWPVLVRKRFSYDRDLAQQALIWLHASTGECLPAAPSLGAGGERFDLVTVLDSGATASVWKAYDRKLGRHVAIKVFHGAESATIRQSLLEARAASEVISEHVVRVHDVHDADPPYIVLELVGEHASDRDSPTPGVSAATLRPHDIAEAVRWVRDIARGVEDAHLHDVFHRDLKPHNVLITPISRRAKIADFGLAISAATAADAHTASGLVLGGRSGPARIAGTPEFMAPEQACGLPTSLDARDPDGRRALVAIDVWGLGAVAYDLLSGTPPWRAGSGVTGWELAASGATPAPLEHTQSGETIPARLRKIVERALALTPADRYPSARAVADELDAYLGRRPTSFDRGAGVRLGLWVRRNPQLTVTATVALVCAAMSFAAYATVVGLRRRSRELATEVHEVEVDKDTLAARAREERRELDDTEATLRTQTASLATVRRTLADTRVEYETIVAAKDHALQTADAATRDLADQLTVARRERDLYEEFWTRARDEVTQVTTERDGERREHDTAIAAREQALKDRDAMRVARDQAEHDRDSVRAERDREATIRRRVETDLSQLAAELAKLRLGVVTPVPSSAGSATSSAAPITPPVITPSATTRPAAP